MKLDYITLDPRHALRHVVLYIKVDAQCDKLTIVVGIIKY